jgi:hypothetical protein
MDILPDDFLTIRLVEATDAIDGEAKRSTSYSSRLEPIAESQLSVLYVVDPYLVRSTQDGVFGGSARTEHE